MSRATSVRSTGSDQWVKSGEVELFFNDRLIETVGPGGILGEKSLVDDYPHTTTAIAKTDCELVLVDEPGSPPQVVEVAPQHTEPAEAGHAGRESQPRDPEATTDRASPGRSAFARTGPGGVMIAPRRVINSVFSGADYYRQPWSWSGGPMPGSSSGESD